MFDFPAQPEAANGTILAKPASHVTSLGVDHLARHPAVHAENLSRHEARVGEVEHRFGDVVGAADAADGVLSVIDRAQILAIRNPAGGDGVDADFGPQTDGEGVGQGDQSAL